MENQYISEAINLCFKVIISQNTDSFQGRNIANSIISNTKALLLRFPAEMVHRSGDLKCFIDTHPDHDFASIPIFMRPALLAELKKIVTTQRSERIRMATIIAPHIEAIS